MATATWGNQDIKTTQRRQNLNHTKNPHHPSPVQSGSIRRSNLNLYPQTSLPTRGATDNPVLAAVENGNRRHGGDTVPSELGELVSGRAVDVDEAVHVADAEALDVGLWVLLPLRTEADGVSKLKQRYKVKG